MPEIPWIPQDEAPLLCHLWVKQKNEQICLHSRNDQVQHVRGRVWPMWSKNRMIASTQQLPTNTIQAQLSGTAGFRQIPYQIQYITHGMNIHAQPFYILAILTPAACTQIIFSHGTKLSEPSISTPLNLSQGHQSDPFFTKLGL